MPALSRPPPPRAQADLLERQLSLAEEALSDLRAHHATLGGKYAAATARIEALSADLEAADERVSLLEGGLWAESTRADSLYVRAAELQRRVEEAQADASASRLRAPTGEGSPLKRGAVRVVRSGVAFALERLAQVYASIARACGAACASVGADDGDTISHLPMPTHPLGHPLALTLLARRDGTPPTESQGGGR